MKRSKSNSGFTLVEVVVTTGLAALLMIAVLTVLGSLTQSQAALERCETAIQWPASLADRVQWDLAHARTMQLQRDGLVLEGYGSLNARTLAPTHRPVKVEYCLQPFDGRTWLVRKQTDLDRLSNRNGWLELFCADVASFRCETVSSTTRPRPKRDHATPDRVKLVVRSTLPAVPTLETVLIIR